MKRHHLTRGAGAGHWPHIIPALSRYHHDMRPLCPHLLLSRCCDWAGNNNNNNNNCWKQIWSINSQLGCYPISHDLFFAQRMTRRPRDGGREQTSVSGSWRSWSAPSSSATTLTCSWGRRSPWGSTSRSHGSVCGIRTGGPSTGRKRTPRRGRGGRHTTPTPRPAPGSR